MTPTSIDQFKTYMEETPASITATFQSTEGCQEAKTALAQADRIFFSGSGSSIPAALLGQQLLTKFTKKAGIFAPSSLLLDDALLTQDDVIVLVTQGWNRADAALITRKVLQSPATLIVVTGRSDRIELYKDIPQQAKLILVPIFPTIEKIFCRPATAVTGYVKITQLLEDLTNSSFSEAQWQAAYTAGTSLPVKTLQGEIHYVVLASSLLLCAGNNVALSLREGAGHHGSLQEIESYGHGQYVPDQARVHKTQYIVLQGPEGTYTDRSFERIKPMLDSTNSSYDIWQSSLDPILGNITHMARIAHIVYKDILNTNWDMNNPPGMEGNRSFHEVNK